MKHGSRYPRARPFFFLFGLIVLGSLVGYSFYCAVLQTDKELKTAQGSVQNLIQFYWDAEDIVFDRSVTEASEADPAPEPSPPPPVESPAP